MFVWSKLSSEKWADAWEERFAGEPRAVITRIAGRSTIRIEVYCEKKKEAEAISKQFGGSVRELKAQNWAAMSQEQPPPVKVRGRLLVVAEKAKTKLKEIEKAHPKLQVISIPADMAFGTGHHATTATVLRMLVDYAKSKEGQPWTMLDLGTGSGVLAIAAEKLGASEAWGCDFDDKAVRVAQENLVRNRTQNVVIEEADVLKWKPSRRWDCVAANLFYDILEDVFPKIVKSMSKHSIVFVSGILRTQADDCLKLGEKAGLVFEEVVIRGKWVTARGRLAGRK
ncbi:50S ribosomal protein L11 methyltransferase [Verrucomicrobium spinosum]|uniref:50S ribosomal protein L11 methyltransferase n=1 Tax=Verrucomicrobium spinosum TaxID=2736 RepID=UPI0001744E32|nr:50S ribosomal protein L11 methyltransferase [Verrucomicrobium spinosum]